eukprot:gene25528-11176_t
MLSSNIDFSKEEEDSSKTIEILRGKGKTQISNVQYINVSPTVVRISWQGSNFRSSKVIWLGGSSSIPYGVFTVDVPGMVPNSISGITLTPVSSTGKEGSASSTLSVKTLPSTLTNVTLTNVTTSGARVNWTGSGYTKVIVTWTGGGSSGYILSGTSFYDASGLSSNSPYTFTVTPYNSINVPGTATAQSTTTLTGSTSMTFTSCGATLRLGPTAANMLSTYGSSVTLGSFRGYQNYTIPLTQSHTITCYGASGGSGTYLGGNGGVVSATFNLSVGQIIIVIVGQKGGLSSAGNSQEGGGGGGTWVVDSATSNLLICATGGNGATTALKGSSPNVLSLPPTATFVTSPAGYQTGSGFNISSTNATGSGNFTEGFFGALGLNNAQGLGLGGFGGGGGGGNSAGSRTAGGGAGWISSKGGQSGSAAVAPATNYVNTTFTGYVSHTFNSALFNNDHGMVVIDKV